MGVERVEECPAGVHGRGHLETVRAQQPDQAVSQQEKVLDDDNGCHRRQGSSANSSVGPPGELVSVGLPSKAASRCWIPRRPLP